MYKPNNDKFNYFIDNKGYTIRTDAISVGN